MNEKSFEKSMKMALDLHKQAVDWQLTQLRMSFDLTRVAVEAGRDMAQSAGKSFLPAE